jgi:MFS transporter, DHA1 family, tetracycline resistance protein
MARRIGEILPFLAAVFIDLFSFGLMYPVIVILFRNLAAHHAPPTASLNLMMSITFAAFPLGMFFGASLLGDISDALGRKTTLLICLTGLSIAYCLMFFGVEFRLLSLLLAGRLLSGLMAGSAPIAQAAMMDLSTPEERGLNMSKVVLVNCVALASAPALGGILADIRLSLPLLLTILLCLCAIMLIARARWTDGHRHALNLDWRRPIMNFVLAARHRQIRWLALSFFLFQLGFGLYYIYVIVLMGNVYKLTPSALGLFSGTIGVGFVVGSTIGYRTLARIMPGDIRICAVSLLVCGGTILLSALCGPVIDWPLAFIAAAANCGAFITTLALISAAAGAENQGWAMGISSAATALAFFLAGLAASLLWLISLPGILIGGSLLLALSAVPLWPLRGRSPIVAATARQS